MDYLELARLYWDSDLRWLPADVGLYRHHVETRADYYNYVLETLNNVQDAYFPFYTPLISRYWPEPQKRAVIVDRLFIDIDVRENDTLGGIWNQSKVFLGRFWNNIDLFFSGSKGFHMKVYINPVTYGELHEQRNRLYDVFCTWFQYLHDKKAFLSLDRICRITLTKHSGTPIRWKVPVDPSMTIEEIMQRSRFPERFVDKMYALYKRQPQPLDWKVFLRSPDELLRSESLDRVDTGSKP